MHVKPAPTNKAHLLMDMEMTRAMDQMQLDNWPIFDPQDDSKSRQLSRPYVHGVTSGPV